MKLKYHMYNMERFLPKSIYVPHQNPSFVFFVFFLISIRQNQVAYKKQFHIKTTRSQERKIIEIERDPQLTFALYKTKFPKD